MTKKQQCLRICATALMMATTCVVALPQGNYPGKWVGKWIWMPGEAHPYHFFLMARRSLELLASPRAAKLHVSAADRYLLYVNGQYTGRGPARSDPRWKSYDSYDVAPLLGAGRNTIAVLAYHYGSSSGYTRDARAGLFAQLEMTFPDGSQRTLGTDERWRIRQARGWSRDVRQIRWSVGMTEVYDANADPPDWAAPSFDDSGWAAAHVIPQRETPWGYLESRQTPMMREREIFPTKLVKVGEAMDLPSRILAVADVPERLMAEPLYPLQYARVDNAGSILRADGRAATFQGSLFKRGDSLVKGTRSPYVIVDFGRPVFGFPRIQLEGPGAAVLEMTYGPQLIRDRVPALSQGVRYGDRYVLRPGKQAWQLFEYKQFRFLQLVVRNADSPLSIDSISLVSYEYPAELKGNFECSDPVLTKVWKAGVDTTYLHMEDALVCDAVRERRVWTGDGAHGLYGIYAAFGDSAISDWFFRLISRGPLPDGMLRMFYPGTDLASVGDSRVHAATAVENPINIPQFALFYALFAGEHYRYFGKLELIAEIYPALAGLAGWCERHADEDGLLYNLPNWNFTDWVKNEMRGANLETNALYYHLLREMAVMATDLGRADEARKFEAGAVRVRDAIRRQHWNPQRELYADSVIDGRQSPIVTECSNGFALLFDIATPQQAPAIVRHLADPHADIVRASPLYFYYALEGLVRAGGADVALKQIRERYAPMIGASDVPTIWETWPDWVADAAYGLLTSYVHSGGVGPTWTLSKHVLGVYPEGPGFRRCRIEPQTGGLDWAKGVFPSVRGEIAVDWKRAAGRFVLDTRLPEDLEADLTLPRIPGRGLELKHNGKRHEIPAGARSLVGLRLSERSIVVPVKGGSHHLEAVVK